MAGDIKGLNKKAMTYKYEKLPIKDKKEMVITGNDIMDILEMKPGSYLKEVLKDIEEKIVLGELNNNLDELKEYVIKTWK